MMKSPIGDILSNWGLGTFSLTLPCQQCSALIQGWRCKEGGGTFNGSLIEWLCGKHGDYQCSHHTLYCIHCTLLIYTLHNAHCSLHTLHYFHLCNSAHCTDLLNWQEVCGCDSGAECRAAVWERKSSVWVGEGGLEGWFVRFLEIRWRHLEPIWQVNPIVIKHDCSYFKTTPRWSLRIKIKLEYKSSYH